MMADGGGAVRLRADRVGAVGGQGGPKVCLLRIEAPNSLKQACSARILKAAEQALEKLGEPGFYRSVQMQRFIWAELDTGVSKLRKSHANSPDGPKKMQEMFERWGGRYPGEEVRAARLLSKNRKKS
jgi:hypothetical protein